MRFITCLAQHKAQDHRAAPAGRIDKNPAHEAAAHQAG